MAWMLNSFVPLQMKGFLSWRGWDVQLLAIGTAFGFISDPKMGLTSTIGGSFYWPQYNTSFNLKVEQYLKEDRGVKFEMIRHFRYCSIGFYAMKAKWAKANGGSGFKWHCRLTSINVTKNGQG